MDLSTSGFSVRNDAGLFFREMCSRWLRINIFMLVSDRRLLFCMAFRRVSAERAWSLETDVCVARQRVWVHRKPIETPAGYHCQLLIKQEKECIGPPAHMAALKRAGSFQITGFPSIHSLFVYLFVCPSHHFYRLLNGANERKHIKRLWCDHFY